VPSAQSTQTPARQTRLSPQPVPSGALPRSSHSGAPALQLIWPVRQRLAVLHGKFGVQSTQPPLLQKRLLPQEVPLSACTPVSMQTAVPVVQASRPR
jgi:hypothetical protein